jgi:tetratricopeptide (TPR) repeat protein
MNFKAQHTITALSKLFAIVSFYSEYLLNIGKPIFGIKPIQTAILKIQDSPEQVCGSLHRELAKLCLKSKCYAHCISIIEQPVTSFKKNSSPMDIVSYLYYKAMILTGLKRYAEAVEAFKSVISYPS